MRAAALALLVLASPLAACDSASGASCPGDAVASLSFRASLVAAGDPALGGLDPVASLPDCDPALGYGEEEERTLAFAGTLARAEAGPGGALCRANGQILFGTQGGDRWEVEYGSAGAVLDGCGATCGAASRTVIRGDLLRDGDGAPSGFAGALVEVLTPDDPACGTCVLPCAARYALEGTVEAG